MGEMKMSIAMQNPKTIICREIYNKMQATMLPFSKK